MVKCVCERCSKAIEDEGMIVEGRCYHKDCYGPEALCNEYSEIEEEVIYDLVELYGHAIVSEWLKKADWCLIYADKNGPQMEIFEAAENMRAFLTKNAKDAIFRVSSCFEILHILYKGEITEVSIKYEVDTKLTFWLHKKQLKVFA